MELRKLEVEHHPCTEECQTDRKLMGWQNCGEPETGVEKTENTIERLDHSTRSSLCMDDVLVKPRHDVAELEDYGQRVEDPITHTSKKQVLLVRGHCPATTLESCLGDRLASQHSVEELEHWIRSEPAKRLILRRL